MGNKTTPDVFIVESLRFADEDAGHMEGRFIEHILKLADRKVRYFYIRTRAELEEVIDKFEDSGYRYLHLSCHADRKGIELTLETLSIDELAEIVAPAMSKRRIFISGCAIATKRLARSLLVNTGCYSVIAPSRDIAFDEAALFWASLYHFPFKNDAQKITRAGLKQNLNHLSHVFDLGIKYYASSTKAEGYVEISTRS